jgi:hypothetical protein
MFSRWLASLAVAVLVLACGSVNPPPSATPSDQPTPSAQPSSMPTDSLPPKSPPASQSLEPSAAPSPAPTESMIVTVLPYEEPPAARPAIPGEKVCFLVQVDDRYIDDGPITFAATGDGLTIDSIPLSVPPPGGVAELWVTIDPHQGTTETTAMVELTVTHGGDDPVDWVERRSIIVTPATDDRAGIAQRYVDFWVGWLATEHPELGIDEASEWESMYVSALWIVSKYAYWNDEWEMVVAWHEMVPPDDFTEVYLRRRDSEVRYSQVYRQESFSAISTPHQVVPPDELIR